MIRHAAHRYQCCDVLLQYAELDLKHEELGWSPRDVLWRDAVSSQQAASFNEPAKSFKKPLKSFKPISLQAKRVHDKLSERSQSFLGLAASLWWAKKDKDLDELATGALDGVAQGDLPMVEALRAVVRSGVDAAEVDRWLAEYRRG